MIERGVLTIVETIPECNWNLVQFVNLNDKKVIEIVRIWLELQMDFFIKFIMRHIQINCRKYGKHSRLIMLGLRKIVWLRVILITKVKIGRYLRIIQGTETKLQLVRVSNWIDQVWVSIKGVTNDIFSISTRASMKWKVKHYFNWCVHFLGV